LIWYLDNPLRYKAERESIDALANASPWLVPLGWRVDASMRVHFDAQIVTPHKIYPITVRYPSHFPFSPPLVLSPKNSERWSYHQYGSDGELCLELGPDNWQPHFTGADQIVSAHRLLMGEGPSADNATEVPSRHELTVGQELRGEVFRMMVTEDMRIAAAAVPDAGWLALGFVSLYQKGSLVFFPSTIKGRDGNLAEDKSVPEPVRVEQGKRPAVLVRWPQQATLPATDSADGLKATIAALGANMSDIVVVVFVQGSRVSAFYLHDDGSTSAFSPIHLIAPRRRLSSEYEGLAAKKVALVGCGSMGSKIATALARCGVGHFLIVDDDIFLPENLARHDLD
jgi:ubiquitin-protein ligase